MEERLKKVIEKIENDEDFLHDHYVLQTFDMIRDRMEDREESMQVNIPYEFCDVLKLLLLPMPVIAHTDEEGNMVMTFDWFDTDMGDLGIDFVVAVNDGVKTYSLNDEGEEEE